MDSRNCCSASAATATQIQRIESLVDRHVDGLIVLPAWGAYLSEELEHYASTLPIVQVGGRRCSSRTSMVSVDENAAMEIVIRHLAERGIASVAYMAGKEISFESAELFAMFPHADASAPSCHRNRMEQVRRP